MYPTGLITSQRAVIVRKATRESLISAKMGQLTKFWRLSRGEKKFLCEASVLLVFSSLCIKVVAFKHIDRFLRRWNDCIQGGIDYEQEYTLIQHSISRAANILPWKSLCLSRSIAEFI